MKWPSRCLSSLFGKRLKSNDDVCDDAAMTARRWMVAVIASGIIIRLALWLCYEPSQWPDTGTYLTAAQDLINGNLIGSEGRRTPGYPLLIALAGSKPSQIMFMQLIGGVVTSLLLFYMALIMTGRAAFAYAAAMTYNLNLQQLFLEGAL